MRINKRKKRIFLEKEKKSSICNFFIIFVPRHPKCMVLDKMLEVTFKWSMGFPWELWGTQGDEKSVGQDGRVIQQWRAALNTQWLVTTACTCPAQPSKRTWLISQVGRDPEDGDFLSAQASASHSKAAWPPVHWPDWRASLGRVSHVITPDFRWTGTWTLLRAWKGEEPEILYE